MGKGSEGDSWLSYNSVQFIKIRNTKLALTYYATIFLILGYVIGYTVVYDMGYQIYDPVVANTMLKVKGSGSAFDERTQEVMVFDEYDLVIPAFIPDASFTGLQYIMTPNQTRSECEGNDETFELCNCTDFNTVGKCCEAGRYTENGMLTGECGPSGEFCMLNAWCPLEEKKYQTAVDGVEDWTLFARVNARFPTFGYEVSNTDGYDAISTPNNVNLFSLGHIVNVSGYTWADVLTSKGAVFVAQFNYNCNLNTKEHCDPEISFFRLDDPDNSVSKGFNFRYEVTNRDFATGELARDLWKLTGVYVIFQVYGQAGQFDIATLGVTLGSGLSYLAVATVVCDVIMQYFLPNKDKYLKRKFDLVDIDERLSNMSNAEVQQQLIVEEA
jgi:hypothetical protein